MWLIHDLRHQSIVIEIFDLIDLATYLVVGMCGLFNVGEEVLILEVDLPVLFVVIDVWVELRRQTRSVDLLLIFFAYLFWAEITWLEGEMLAAYVLFTVV
jgi:hypothetical protein